MSNLPTTIKGVNALLAGRYAVFIRMKINEDDDAWADDERLSLKNLMWMCETLNEKQDEMSEDKTSRWLGFVQGCLAMRKIINSDAERDFSRPLYHNVYRRLGMETPASMQR